MGIKLYKLTISLTTVEQPVEIEFYSPVSEVHKNVQQFVDLYDSDVVNYYTVRSL